MSNDNLDADATKVPEPTDSITRTGRWLALIAARQLMIKKTGTLIDICYNSVYSYRQINQRLTPGRTPLQHMSSY